MQLNIKTPEKMFYSGEVSAVNIPATDGEYVVLDGHRPAYLSIEVGVLKVTESGERLHAFCSDGFAEITPKSVNIFAKTCEWPNEIDEANARREQERLTEQLRHKNGLKEYKETEISLLRAMTRLKIKSKYIK